MKTVVWYFDFISPYAWLQCTQLGELQSLATVQCKPVLFAGLLKHWGQKGPAEMSTKRIFTYQQIAWLAHQQGLKLTWPNRHPFNPLPLLRLSAALGNTPTVIEQLFNFVWRDGHLPDEPEHWNRLLNQLSITPKLLENPSIKNSIRANTDQAIERGIFGVPSSIVLSHHVSNDHQPNQSIESPIFWGFDSINMLQAWLRDDAYFQSPTFVGASLVGAGVIRKT
jgi:2-hydroxychromene-2-carboxylate isomerase